MVVDVLTVPELSVLVINSLTRDCQHVPVLSANTSNQHQAKKRVMVSTDYSTAYQVIWFLQWQVHKVCQNKLIG